MNDDYCSASGQIKIRYIEGNVVTDQKLIVIVNICIKYVTRASHLKM